MKPYAIIATWFGLGLSPKAPGTIGSLGAIPFALAVEYVLGIPGLVLFIMAVSFIGLHAADKFGKQTGITDDQRIVIDEVAGQSIAMLAAGFSPVLILAAFIFFRAFDITKPGPVGWCEKKIPGAGGVMADDITAGIYALICVMLVRYAGLG